MSLYACNRSILLKYDKGSAYSAFRHVHGALTALRFASRTPTTTCSAYRRTPFQSRPFLAPPDIKSSALHRLLPAESVKMSVQLDFAALNTCLQELNHLFVDISRLTPGSGYEEQIGGYGTVRVSTLDSGAPGAVLVAAKTIRLKDRHKDPKRLAFRLARELKIWAGFRHPHVLPLMGYFLDKDYKIAVLISRYMIRGDLKEYIDQQKPLWDARLHLVCDVTDGLAYLHEQSPPVLHGDIKMKNVLVSATTRGMLADFGLSKALEDGPTGLTTSDGLKVLEALADRIPYGDKKSEHSILHALINGEPPSDTETLSFPVPDLKSLLRRCWNLQPSERPSASDCLRVVESALSTPRLASDIQSLIEELRALLDTPLIMKDVEELQRRAVDCGLPSDNEQAIRLTELAERGRQWCKHAHVVLDSPVIALEDLNKLVAPPCSVPVFQSLLERVENARNRAREIEKQAKAILYPCVGRRTPISEALRLVSTTQKNFLIPAIQILAEVAPQAAHIEETCFDIINNRYSLQPLHKPLFEELWDMRNTVQRKLWMFSIPSFDIVDKQLVQHIAWLEKLPWYRAPEPAMRSKSIVDDVVQNTRPEDDKPPLDPECTCLCALPVKVTVENQADAVQCDHCGAKFHPKCIEGSCPFCDPHHWNGFLNKPRNFEYIDLLPIATAAPDLTRNYSLAWKHVDIITTYVDRLTRAIDIFLAGVDEQNINPAPPHLIPQTRHFLRKLYKMQFSIKARPDVPSYGLTLCHVHRLLANDTKSSQGASQKKKTQRRPKFIFSAEVMPLASDGSRCLCKGSHVGHRLITCNSCSYNFHGYCVRYDEASNPAPKPWRCPMCMIRKGKQYPQSAVRVRTVAEKELDVYVDTKACFENYSWQLIRQRLPPPTVYTVILELERFISGSNQSLESSLASQPHTSAESSTPVPREPSQISKPEASPPSASISGPTLQAPTANGPSTGSSKAVVPSRTYITRSVSKRKAPTSPAAEDTRRMKSFFPTGDKATDELMS
ncbi:hypothetical protein FRC01_007127 [Tulasnella sp. 417]|nr:hypothetical protein FRC01_007127 [Tulasnella sp. 417]